MSEPDYECENCGTDVDVIVGGECIYRCSDCVPVGELRDLIEDWRERSERQQTPEEWATFGKCAGELEALLQE